MATIASLAVRLTANIDNFEKNFKTVSSTVESLAKKTASVRPTMANLMDAAEGYATSLGSVKKAEEMLKSGTFLDGQRDALSQTVAAADDLRKKLESMATQVPKDMFNMNPTMENVQRARREIEKMIALKQELSSQGLNTDIFGGAIEKAQQGMATFANKAMQVQAETAMIRSTLNGINAAPFMVLSVMTADLLSGMRGFGEKFNETFGGMPARIAQTVAVVGVLTIGVGLLYAKTAALGISTSFFMTLWKSSMIYQGLAGVITLLNTVLGTQLAINTATMVWVGIATLGIGALVAGAVYLVSSWNDQTAAIKESENSMKSLEEQTQAIASQWQTLNSTAKTALESLMTPAERLVAKMKEIDEVANKDDAMMAQAKKLAARQQQLSQWIQEGKGYGWFSETDIQKQHMAEFKSVTGQLDQLTKDLRTSVKITDEQAAALKENARLETLKNTYGNLLDETIGFQTFYNNTLKQLAADLETKTASDAEAALIQENLNKQLRDKLGMEESPAALLANQLDLLQFALEKTAITQDEYTAKVQEAMAKWDPATIAAAEAAQKLAEEQEKLAKEMQTLADKFRGMGTKDPLKTFETLTSELESVRDKLKPEEFDSALAKLRSDLASGLGLSDFVNPKQTLSMNEVMQRLADNADRLGLSQTALTAAQDQARAAFEKQSEMYSLYQKAQDALLTPQQRLAETLAKIDAEAQKFGWQTDAVNKMKDLATQDIMGGGQSNNLADQFRDMGKTALESFKELSVQLRSVQNELTPAQFAAAKNKLLGDLASGLGISQFLTDSGTAAQQLAATYKNLDSYAREAGLADKELTAAKLRAKDALMKQSGYYSLYQKAQDSMLTTQQKLQRELAAITADGKLFGWDNDIVKRMQDLKTEELLGKGESGESKTSSINQSDNAALEYGTTAYYEAQLRGNKPLVDEAKKANRHLANITVAVAKTATDLSKRQHLVQFG